MPQDISDYFTSDSYKREKRLTSLPSKNVVREGGRGHFVFDFSPKRFPRFTGKGGSGLSAETVRCSFAI